MLTLGTGIGGGLLAERRDLPRRAGWARELGHMVRRARRGRLPGDCPGRGCLETLVSGTAIGREGRRARRRSRSRRSGGGSPRGGRSPAALVTELAREGDAAARAVLARSGAALGAGLVGLVNAFNPEVIVIGGGAVRGGELLLGPAREVVAERALPPAATRCGSCRRTSATRRG